jgi:tetratricopeptide (TPR) repeat protein
MAKHKPDNIHSGPKAEDTPALASPGGSPVLSPPLRLVRNATFLSAILFLLVLAAFSPSLRNDFINYDDDFYVTENIHVQRGLTWESAKWAFQSAAASNWHPLTWLSHMMDCEMFGLKPWGHHLTSVLFHGVNTVLVFLALRGLTWALWRSFIVAALFGLHPLHVESVAWVAERKDVLSAFFWLLTMWAYGKYAGKFDVGRSTLDVRCSKSKIYYTLALLFFALGLMSKPMVVTLPCVLLLLDYWPLKRNAAPAPERGLQPASTQDDAGASGFLQRLWKGLALKRHKCRAPGTAPECISSASWARLTLEKIPFFLLAAAASVVTYAAQKGGGATWSGLPLSARLENAPVSYCRYLWKMFWPTKLAVFYPHPGHWPTVAVLLSVLLLAGVTLVVFLMRRESPYLVVGWLWFVGTLVPVIGLVQVGEQAMADRYMYLPSIGLFVMFAWGLFDLTKGWHDRATVLSAVGAVTVILCAILTHQQAGYWKNSRTLFEHTLAVTERNATACLHVGSVLLEEKKLDEAMGRFQEALKVKPDFADAHGQLGVAFYLQGRRDDAIRELQAAILLDPGYAPAHFNLGVALTGKNRLDEAISQFQAALKRRPEYAEAHNGLGVALSNQGRADDAISQFEQAISLKPDYAAAHCNLGVALASQGRRAEAIAQFTRALQLQPDYPQAERQLRALSTPSQP